MKLTGSHTLSVCNGEAWQRFSNTVDTVVDLLFEFEGYIYYRIDICP